MAEIQYIPCPFCGSGDIRVQPGLYETPPKYYAECKECGAKGPSFDIYKYRHGYEKAGTAWNTRT
jgi:Lar family restriction alleviation protein